LCLTDDPGLAAMRLKDGSYAADAAIAVTGKGVKRRAGLLPPHVTVYFAR